MEMTNKISIDMEDVKTALELVKELNIEVEKSNNLLREQLRLIKADLNATEDIINK